MKASLPGRFDLKTSPPSSLLTPIPKCDIKVGPITVPMYALPDISDSKSASYADETGIGRSMPFKSYQWSDNRTINWTAHYVATSKSDIKDFLRDVRRLTSACYPQQGTGTPFRPPPLCTLRCLGLMKLTSAPSEIAAVMKSYSIKYDTSVPWDEETGLPYKFDVDMVFEVVLNQTALPTDNLIALGSY